MADSADYAVLRPSDTLVRLETTLELLRREWRGGCLAGNGYQTALRSVRRMRQAGVSEQYATDLATILAGLEAYEGLTVEQRRAVLPSIADAIKGLVAQITPPSRPVQPRSTFESESLLALTLASRSSQDPLVELSASPAAVITALHRLSPSDFEKVVASLLHAQGFSNVQIIGGANDRGVDIICNDGVGSLVAIQCKRYNPTQKISAIAIQHLKTMAFVRKASRSIFVTTAGFTDSAMEQANEFSVELVGGYALAEWLLQHPHILSWVTEFNHSDSGAPISSYGIAIAPVKIPHDLSSFHRLDVPKRTKIQDLLSRHHPDTPATISNSAKKKGTADPQPQVTPDQFRQAVALCHYYIHAEQVAKRTNGQLTGKKSSQSRKEIKLRMYLLTFQDGTIRDYAVQSYVDPNWPNRSATLHRCHYLAPGQVVTASDLWKFWVQAREQGMTAGSYYTNTYFSCGAYLYVLEQPNFLIAVRQIVDWTALGPWFSQGNLEFMSLATKPVLPECFTVGDIEVHQTETPRPRKRLWQRILRT